MDIKETISSKLAPYLTVSYIDIKDTTGKHIHHDNFDGGYHLNAIIVSLGMEPQAWLTISIWNNLFLMAIMIWIQTGLALVIFSAALRGIPNETIEAARIDGASEFRIFWSIIIPYLEQTILVIWTIITILVLKVFDIIYAMTNGEWQTEVLANLMYDWMFRGGGDSGRGSVLAFCIMIGVIPILAWNLYRHKQEQKT